MLQAADALIRLSNDALLKAADKSMPLQEAFERIDEQLCDGVRGISEFVIAPTLINLDLEDVRAILSAGDVAQMAIGRAEGENAGRRAAEAAVSSLLLEAPLGRASRILFNVTGGPDLSLFDVNEAAAQIHQHVHPDANMIFGARVEEAMGDAIRITLVAAGFEGGADAFAEPIKKDS